MSFGVFNVVDREWKRGILAIQTRPVFETGAPSDFLSRMKEQL
jgi:hypothetical protein